MATELEENLTSQAEWALIEGTEVIDGDSKVVQLAQQVLNGEYIAVFQSDFARSLLTTDDTTLEISSEDEIDIRDFLDTAVNKWFDSETSTPSRKEFKILTLGITALHAFLQVNYTGPYLPFDSLNLLPPSLRTHKSISKALLHALVVDGERPYHLTPHPYFLVIASVLLNRPSRLQTAAWWKARVNFLNQRVLEGESATLHDRIYSAMDEVRVAITSRDRDTKGRHDIEQGIISTYYGQDNKALQLLQAAGVEVGLEWILTGALGRRTKFQTFDVSQLVVLARGRDRTDNETGTAPNPATLDLNDDTLLEKVSFTEKLAPTSSIPESLSSLDPSNPTPLHPLDSTILLALTTCIKNTNPGGGLTMEEMAPYVARVIAHPRNWSVHTMALLIRTRLEHTRARTIQRSVLQLQALVDQLVDEIGPSSGTDAPKHSFLPKPSEPTESASTRIRLEYAWQLLIPSIWDLEAELAQRWISIGALKTALEIFEKLEMWDKVAICWAGTGRQDKASQILSKQLEKDPDNAKLWSLLGDVEKNPEHWETAWKVSGQRYARAQRALGEYYFHLKNYSKARDAFNLSLKINPLNQVAWFTYGCACLELSDYEESCEAFSRCVGLDSQDSESWSNLASGLLKLNRKRDAWQALKQATAGNYENWKIWQNYTYVSIDVGEFSEAIRSMKRVVEVLGSKKGEACIDEEVVEILVQRAVQDDPTEGRGVGRQVMELFTKSIVPLITSSARLWNAAARLFLWNSQYSDALDAHIKAFRTYLNHPGLETDATVWKAAVEEGRRLLDAYRNLGEKPGRMGGEVCKDWRYQARSALRGLKGRGKTSHEGTEAWDELESLLEDTKN
jgi:tetratricopeptide (TPR) repeat protein